MHETITVYNINNEPYIKNETGEGGRNDVTNRYGAVRGKCEKNEPYEKLRKNPERRGNPGACNADEMNEGGIERFSPFIMRNTRQRYLRRGEQNRRITLRMVCFVHVRRAWSRF